MIKIMKNFHLNDEDSKKRLVRLVELFIWLIIITVIGCFLLFARSVYKNSFTTYQIFMPDIYGLIEGSPVRMMGIQIGYVNKIEIVGDEIYVRFLITDKSVKLPCGVVATVEFTGLGGSKSLELYAPQSYVGESSDNFIVVKRPQRIHDSAILLNDMFEKIGSITYRFSYFVKQVKPEMPEFTEIELKKLREKPQDILKSADVWIDKQSENMININKKLKEYEKNEQRQSENN